MVAKYKQLLQKSIAATISSIEIYNKPDFKYREETFSILMVNAWELLLKAKILRDANNDLKSIYIKGKIKNKDGTPTKRFHPKLNRSFNPKTIEISKAIEIINLPDTLKMNLISLLEIRDNAIHFINKDPFFQKKILEVGTANLKNYVRIFNEWFEDDLSQYNFYLMPISFFHTFEIESFSINKQSTQTKNLLAYILQLESKYPSNHKSNYHISLKLETKFTKSTTPNTLKVQYDPKSPLKMTVEEENEFLNKYPMDYDTLIKKMSKRYKKFKTNNDFYNLKRNLEENKTFAGKRFLDAKNQKGTSKIYYSTEIFKEFDKHYLR